MSSGSDEQRAREFIDPEHERAGVSGGGRMGIAPGKVLTNIEHAMQRVELDINTPVAIEDFVSPEELWVLVDTMQMGPLIVAHTVNTGFAIMLGRYPHEMVLAAFAPEFDLRAIVPLEITDHQHTVARAIVEHRARGAGELGDGAVAEHLAGCSHQDQAAVFIAVFYMYGLKVGALKNRLGMD